MPPESVSKLYIDHSKRPEYRKSPFIIQAACQGDVNCFETLLKNGCRLGETGFIGFSKKRKNLVISNILGAASFNGSTKIVKYMLKKPASAGLDYLASEKKDFQQTGPFNQEYTGYTPIMLSVASGGQNIDCTRILFEANC